MMLSLFFGDSITKTIALVIALLIFLGIRILAHNERIIVNSKSDTIVSQRYAHKIVFKINLLLFLSCTYKFNIVRNSQKNRLHGCPFSAFIVGDKSPTATLLKVNLIDAGDG